MWSSSKNVLRKKRNELLDTEMKYKNHGSRTWASSTFFSTFSLLRRAARLIERMQTSLMLLKRTSCSTAVYLLALCVLDLARRGGQMTELRVGEIIYPDRGAGKEKTERGEWNEKKSLLKKERRAPFSPLNFSWPISYFQSSLRNLQSS